MIKRDVVVEVAKALKTSQGLVNEVVMRSFDAIAAALARGETVSFDRFGTFRIHVRQAHKGRDPRNGRELRIAAKHYVRFKPAKALKAAVEKRIP